MSENASGDVRIYSRAQIAIRDTLTREVAAQHWHPLFKDNGNQPLDDGVNRFIVNFSSVSARSGNIGQIDYTAAKGAIEAMTRTTALEFSGYRARVNAVAPGPVDTPMSAGHQQNFLWGKKRNVARGIVRAMERRGHTSYLPRSWAVVMAIVRVLPEFVFQRFGFLAGR